MSPWPNPENHLNGFGEIFRVPESSWNALNPNWSVIPIKPWKWYLQRGRGSSFHWTIREQGFSGESVTQLSMQLVTRVVSALLVFSGQSGFFPSLPKHDKTLRRLRKPQTPSTLLVPSVSSAKHVFRAVHQNTPIWVTIYTHVTSFPLPCFRGKGQGRQAVMLSQSRDSHHFTTVQRRSLSKWG